MPTSSSEIQSLTTQSNNLSASIDRWNSSYVWFGGIALLIALFVFTAQFIIIRKSRLLATVQGNLLAAKDRELQIDLRDKDVQIAGLHAEASRHQQLLEEAALQISHAGADAAHANERAAEANRLAEQERLERTKLEAEIAPRRLSQDQQTAIALIINRYNGRRVRVSSYSMDAESAVLAKQVVSALNKANLQVVDATASISPVGGFALGIIVTGTNVQLASALRSALSLNGNLLVAPADTPMSGGMQMVYGVSGPSPDAEILIAVKPPTM